jgi:hypothetical protein
MRLRFRAIGDIELIVGNSGKSKTRADNGGACRRRRSAGATRAVVWRPSAGCE